MVLLPFLISQSFWWFWYIAVKDVRDIASERKNGFINLRIFKSLPKTSTKWLAGFSDLQIFATLWIWKLEDILQSNFIQLHHLIQFFNPTNLTKARDNCTEAVVAALRSKTSTSTKQWKYWYHWYYWYNDSTDSENVNTHTHTDIWWKRRMARRGSATFKGDYISSKLPRVSQ